MSDRRKCWKVAALLRPASCPAWPGVATWLALAGCYQYEWRSTVAYGEKTAITRYAEQDGTCQEQEAPPGQAILNCDDREVRTLNVAASLAAVALLVLGPIWFIAETDPCLRLRGNCNGQ